MHLLAFLICLSFSNIAIIIRKNLKLSLDHKLVGVGYEIYKFIPPEILK
jgi:hypothetical protein